MKKQTALKLLSMMLVLVLSVSLVFTGCTGKNPYKSEHTVNTLSTAIRSLADSDFTDLKLITQIYTVAFTNSAKVDSYLPEGLEETFAKYSYNEVDELLVGATVAYGGADMSDVTIGKLKISKTIKENKLYVGDLLFVNLDGTYSYYVYDKSGFINLSNPLNEVDTKGVLSSLSQSKQFVLLRPMLNMTNYDFVTGKLETLKLTEAQQALLVTAQSYLLRGDKIQYVSFTGMKGENYIGVKTPEDRTSDNYSPLQCAGFCYDVYKQALGMDIIYEGKALNSTAGMTKYGSKLGIEKYAMECQTSDKYTDEQREQITNEILDLLEPGDILVVRRVADTGHAMLYVGNENIIHSGGGTYNESKKTETYEATVRMMRFKDYFCTEGTSGYIFGLEAKGGVTSFTVLRPLELFDGEIPETTKNRIENLQGVMVQKISSHNISLTADIGEEITYTFEMYNQNDKEITLNVSDVVPEKTEYVSGADKVDGNNLSWQVTIPANTRKKVSYVVKVSADAQKGDVIVGVSGLVGGVPTNCPGVTVGNALTKTEQETVKNVITNYQATDGISGFEIVNDIYKQAFGWEKVFDDTDFDAVYSGNNGVYNVIWDDVKLEHIAEKRINTKYAKMVAPNLSFGYGTKEKKEGNPVVMVPKEQQLVVGDILIVKTTAEKRYLYIYGGDGVFYNLMNGYKEDTRSAQERMAYFLRVDLGCSILRPSLAY